MGLLLDEHAPVSLWEVEGALGETLHRAIDLVDLRRSPPLLRFEIARHGRPLLERQEGEWKRFQFRALLDWWDWAPTARHLHRLASDGLRRELPMVRRDVAAQKIATARTRLTAADEIFLRPREEFLADERERDLATFYLVLAIQECIDLAAHWVVDEGCGAPEEAGDAFDLLRDKGVLDRELARTLRAPTGLRNRIGHGYGPLEPERTHEEYPPGSQALRRFLALVAEEVGL